MLGGRYRVERCLGGGGMASVFRATHVGLDQPVAVKVVSPLVRELPGVVSRFMREARAATRLKGEHVVRVFDVGAADDGAPYFVMELLEGRDLGELLDQGVSLGVEEAVDYALQACEALAEVHGLGIVHRDLKPANLFVTRGPDGLACVKLIDFGISRIDSPLSPEDAVALTSPEVVMGSPRYMPPEQMESAAAADSRSDLWGLGAILYQMLTGRAPFDGESLFDIYAAAVRAPPPAPSSLRAEVPAGLDAVVLRALRVDPADRHADVVELACALAPFGDGAAAARVESVARVLDAARARGHGTAARDGVAARDARATPASDKSPSSSRIRRRPAPALGRRRARVVGFIATALVMLGVGIAARPLSERLDLAGGEAASASAVDDFAAATPADPTDLVPALKSATLPTALGAATPAGTDALGAATPAGTDALGTATPAALGVATPVALGAATPAALGAADGTATPAADGVATARPAARGTPPMKSTAAPSATDALAEDTQTTDDAAREPRAERATTDEAAPPPASARPPASAPQPRAPAARSDERSLFEERK
ncbi:MAG: protein kinase [Labilithrix sp.]|nr:protein kinase [Labilithrix sp.]